MKAIWQSVDELIYVQPDGVCGVSVLCLMACLSILYVYWLIDILSPSRFLNKYPVCTTNKVKFYNVVNRMSLSI